MQTPPLQRRSLLKGALAGAAMSWGHPGALFALATAGRPEGSAAFALVAATDRSRILRAADAALTELPRTIVAVPSPRNPGGLHSYFSQADYFWPNPQDPNGPYINRDGQSNPDNFDGHRQVLVRLALLVPQLTAAWLLTRDKRYAQAAANHLRAWFVAPATRMDPNLEFSQGVVGRSTGRNYGIIDTLHLVEVARSAVVLRPVMTASDRTGVATWFGAYLNWMDTSQKGTAERDTRNNHATCWALQAAEYARVTGNEAIRARIRQWYSTQLLAVQMGLDGSFPLELARTKPYSYSIFNFDVTASLAQSLKSPGDDVPAFALPDGRGLCKAAAWLYPYLQDKDKWPYKHDVQHFDALPVRSPGLLFAGLACRQPDYIALWKTLDPDPTDREILRNFPVRQPLLWV